MKPSPSRLALAAALFALSVLFSLWFHDDRHRTAALLVFALPPLLLLVGVLQGDGRKAAFWSGVGGLFWFSHGVMTAWSRPLERAPAWCEIALAIAIVIAASWPGLRARFGGRR